jgi:SAM-dependent methyltransferase
MIADKPVPEINVDKLMHGIREAIPRRSNLHASTPSIRTSTGSASLDLDDITVGLERIASGVDPPTPVQLSLSESDWQSTPTSLPGREEDPYHFRDFLAYDDVDFVRAAYQAILGRETDQDGSRCYLAMLRDGAPKAEILHRIRRSPEGRQRGAKIDGLRLPYIVDSVSRWPIIGRVIAVAVAIWNLPATERSHIRLSRELSRRLQQNEQHFARSAQTATAALRRLERSQNALSELTRQFASRAHSEALQNAVTRTIAALQVLQRTTTTHVDKGLFEDQVNDLRAKIETIAESAADEAAQLQIRLISEFKADCWECERRVNDIGASVQTIADAKADIAALAQTQMAIENVARKFELLRESKADAVALQNFDALLLRTMETKAERHELSALTNHLIVLLEHRVTKNELELVCSSIEKTNDAIDHIRKGKADISDLSGLGAEIKEESRVAFDEVKGAVQGLANTKADQAVIDALRLELSATFEESSVAAKETLQSSMNDLDRKFDYLEQSKVDRAVIEAVRIEVNDALQQASRNWTNQLDHAVSEKADLAITMNQTSAVDALNSALASVNSQAHDLKRNVLDQDRRVGLLLEEARKRFPKTISAAQIGAMITEDDHRLDAMYAAFEDQFRGTRADIRRRQSVYLPYVRQARAGTAHAPIIDVGCGRGEWLELLRDEGFVARGVDLNRIFLDGCRELSLDVSEEDALVFLRQLKRDSVGLVTSFHMIEHLDHKILVALLDETLRVLQPGGIVIFETPNPRNVVVGSCNFYLDPTHKRPLPPDLSRYLLEARGFSNVEVLELHPCGVEQMVSEGSQKIRDTLNHMLYSSQDYAVIGRKV